MTKLHIYLGVAVLATNGLTALWGAIAWTRRDPSSIFWYLLRTAQVVVVVQVVLGVVLLASGKKPADSLHYVYGALPLVVSLVCEAARVSIAQAELEETGSEEKVEEQDQRQRRDRPDEARQPEERQTMRADLDVAHMRVVVESHGGAAHAKRP